VGANHIEIIAVVRLEDSGCPEKSSRDLGSIPKAGPIPIGKAEGQQTENGVRKRFQPKPMLWAEATRCSQAPHALGSL
jgi:hypothetical protein